MDSRKTLVERVPQPLSREIHSDSPDIHAGLSLEKVCQDFAPRVFNVARRMVGSDLDAEDITQDVLLQIVRKLPTFRGESAFPTWLHRVTVNAALLHRRRQAIREGHGLGTSTIDFQKEEDSLDNSAHRSITPDALILGRETRQQIDKAIAALPEEYREVFLLSDVEGLPNGEIAERLEISLAAVKSRLHRARSMMRNNLASYFPDDSE